MEGASRFKRFVYVHEGNTSKFPMHFGVEVAAKVTDEILIDYFVLASLQRMYFICIYVRLCITNTCMNVFVKRSWARQKKQIGKIVYLTKKRKNNYVKTSKMTLKNTTLRRQLEREERNLIWVDACVTN